MSDKSSNGKVKEKIRRKVEFKRFTQSRIKIPQSIKIKDFLFLWDKYSSHQRKQVLKRFVKHFDSFIIQNESWSIEHEIGEMATLFYSRLISFFQLKLIKYLIQSFS